MNILIIRSNPVAPDPRVEKEAASLAKSGHNVEILAWDRSSDHALTDESLELNGHTVRICRVGIKAPTGAGIKNIFNILKYQQVIRSFIKSRKGRYDAIHACDFDTAFPAFIARSPGTRFVYDIFDYYVDGYNVPRIAKGLVEKCETGIINKADAVIICSEKRRQQIAGSRPKRLYVVHNTPAKFDFVSENGKTPDTDRIKLAYIGNLEEERNIPEMCEFVAEHPGFELHIAGFGYYADKVREYSEKYQNIVWYGRINYEEAVKLESSCDIMPALYDPKNRNNRFAAPNKFYEALLLGKPLLMAKGSGMSEYVEEYGLGVVAPFEDFGMGLVKLAEMRDIWPEISVNGKKLYDEMFSWNIMEKRLLDLYEDIK